MKPLLYAHPFSSYSQMVLIALCENDTPFTSRTIGGADPVANAEFKMKRGPTGRCFHPERPRATNACCLGWRDG